MTNYDFFDLTGLPFDPPEKSAKKVKAAIDKKVKELGAILVCETQRVKRDEMTEQIKLLNDINATILDSNDLSSIKTLAEKKLDSELKKLLSIIGLMMDADITVLSEPVVKYYHRKSGLSYKRICDEFETLGFSIHQEKAFDVRELFPKNIKHLCDDLISLNRLTQSNSCDSSAIFVDNLYSFIAYLMETPENKLSYKKLSTEELRGMITVLSKTLCNRCDSVGMVAASIATYAKTCVFDSEEHRNSYDLYLRYFDLSFQNSLRAMEQTHISVLLDDGFAKMCISKIESVLGDYDTAVAVYNSICLQKGVPYLSLSKHKYEEHKIDTIKQQDQPALPKHKKNRYYGIDLGTTYSAISTLDDNGIPEVIVNHDEGSCQLAAAVYFQEGGDPVVGEVAKSQKDIDPERVVEFAKRYIGKFDTSTYEFDDVTYDPITISALIIRRMMQYSSEQGYDVKDVVITCPAYFGSQEKSDTRAAAMIAGLNVLSVINEPTAAVLSYCYYGLKSNSKILVYDLGGANFDVTLLDYKIDDDMNGKLEIISVDGNDRLGGVDWDARMYDYMCEAYAFENGLYQDEMNFELQQKIKDLSERVKKDLSVLQKKSYAISYDGDRTRIELTREDFESRTQDLVEETVFIVNRLLEKNGLSVDNVDIVLLVGGSTKMPMIKNAVEAMFPGKVRIEDPELAVAKGAALAAAIDSGIHYPITSPEIIIDDGPRTPVLEKSVGIKVFSNNGMRIKNLLYKGAELPQEATFMLNTATDNQESIKIDLYANSSTDDEICMDFLDVEGAQASISNHCEVSIALHPETPALTPIELHLYYDGTLSVSAVNLHTGTTFETVILWPDEEK